MPLIVLGVEIRDNAGIKQFSRKWRPIQKALMQEVAREWHSRVLESHFTPGNRGRYQMQTRTRFYTQVIKQYKGTGQGRFVDLILRGASRRFMRHFFKITGTQHKSTLRMKAPIYFTRPYIGPWRDARTGKTKVVRQQPNKPKEATTISTRDRVSLARFLRDRTRVRLRELKKQQ